MANPERLQQFRAEFQRDPQLLAEAERLLGKPESREPEVVVIKTDVASVDLAITRALALAVDGIVARIEL